MQMMQRDVWRGGRGRIRLLAIAAIVLAGCASVREIPDGASAAPVAQAQPAISAAALRRHVVELAGDAYQGRGAGYPGEEKAAAYVAARFKEIGLRPVVRDPQGRRGYLQTFSFHPRGPERPGQVLASRNVVGWLRGRDAALRHQVVVLGAHHDGQGRTGEADPGRYPALDPANAGDAIWNSADDDASGIAALIEIARVLAAPGMRPRRSIVFVSFSAEEHALDGSARYVSDPPLPLQDHAAMIDMEKLGRMPDQELIVASTSTSPAWVAALAAVNRRTGRNVVSAFDDLVTDADDYPFALRGIPAIVAGIVHQNDTHRPTDTADKIDFAALAGRADYILQLLREVADRDARPEFSGAIAGDPGVLAVPASVSERGALGLAGDAGALKISALIPALPGIAAGLAPGDFVIAIGGRALPVDADPAALAEALRAATPVTLAVIRDGVPRSVALRR
jgi:Peptidase family M28